MEKLKCSICGFDKYTGSLHIHHKDHNHQNNDESNLMVLCANCHMEHHHKNTLRIKIKKQKLDIRKITNKNDIILPTQEQVDVIGLIQDNVERINHDVEYYKKKYFIETYKTAYLNNWILNYSDKETVQYIQSIINKIQRTGQPQ